MKNSVIKLISKKHRYLLIVEVIMSVCMNIAIIMGTGMIANLIDEFIQNGQTEFKSILLLTFVCMLVGTVAAYYKRYFAGIYSVTTAKDINDYAVEKLSRIKYTFFEKEGLGKLITKLISDIGELEQYYESTLTDLINNIISIVMVLFYVGTKNIMLMFASLCLYPIVLIITYFFGKKLKVLANKRRGKIDVMVERVTDSIEGIEIVRSYNLYDKFVSHIHDAIEDILNNEYVRAWITHFSQTVNRLLFWVPNMVCPLFAMFMVIKGEMTIGAMTAYIVLLNKIMGGIKMMPFLLNEYRERQISIERIERIFEEAEENLTKDLSEFINSNNERIAVEFDKVSFKYDENMEPVLKEMSFKIPKGNVVAFVGESGQGKSTIFKLLCGFYENVSGNIFINGQQISGMGLSDVREQIAVVEQEPFLFEGTIFDNIAVGRVNATKEQVIDAAKFAGIHEFIVDLPKQYNTKISENGLGLSGGQRQRIAIARALLKGAPILLMDEPTSAVDVDTEKIIQDTISNLSGRKTILIIAHRLSTICDADNILVVDKGGIWESGTHQELMNANSVYRNLYEYEQKGAL